MVFEKSLLKPQHHCIRRVMEEVSTAQRVARLHPVPATEELVKRDALHA
jgi:hypothetical protein